MPYRFRIVARGKVSANLRHLIYFFKPSRVTAHLAEQDIAADRGFLYFDLHGDTTPFLLRTFAGAWGRSRVVIERAIAKRQAEFRRGTDEVLHEWE